MIGRGDFYTNWIHLEDAASAIVFSIQHWEAFKGKIINVSDGQSLLYAEMLNELSAHLRHKRPFYLPTWLAKLVLGKNSFAYLTNSYRLKADPLLKDWQPAYPDFISSVKNMAQV